jgi:hypothetical protein
MPLRLQVHQQSFIGDQGHLRRAARARLGRGAAKPAARQSGADGEGQRRGAAPHRLGVIQDRRKHREKIGFAG